MDKSEMCLIGMANTLALFFKNLSDASYISSFLSTPHDPAHPIHIDPAHIITSCCIDLIFIYLHNLVIDSGARSSLLVNCHNHSIQ